MTQSIIGRIQRRFLRRNKPGSAPGTLVELSDIPQPVVTVLAYGPEDECQFDDCGLDEIRQCLDRYPVTWINVDGVSNVELLERLGSMLKLHPLALEDVLHPHQRPKVDAYPHMLFVVARMVSAQDEMTTEQLSMFIGDRFVLTFQETQPGDCLDPVRERIRYAQGRIRQEKTDYLLYAILDAVVDNYFPVVEHVGNRLDELDEQILTGSGGDTVSEMHRLRSDLMLLRRAIWPHRDAINELMRDSHEQISPETRVFLRDCYDHTIQLIDVLEACRETCADLRDFYFTSLSSRQNEVMQTLTVISTVFIPLSFVAGVYGMNFDFMPELRWRYGYYGAIGVMFAIAAALLGWFWKRGWFRT